MFSDHYGYGWGAGKIGMPRGVRLSPGAADVCPAFLTAARRIVVKDTNRAGVILIFLAAVLCILIVARNPLVRPPRTNPPEIAGGPTMIRIPDPVADAVTAPERQQAKPAAVEKPPRPEAVKRYSADTIRPVLVHKTEPESRAVPAISKPAEPETNPKTSETSDLPEPDIKHRNTAVASNRYYPRSAHASLSASKDKKAQTTLIPVSVSQAGLRLVDRKRRDVSGNGPPARFQNKSIPVEPNERIDFSKPRIKQDIYSGNFSPDASLNRPGIAQEGMETDRTGSTVRLKPVFGGETKRNFGKRDGSISGSSRSAAGWGGAETLFRGAGAEISPVFPLTALKVCAEPDREFKLRNRLASILDGPGTYESGDLMFRFKGTATAYSLDVEIIGAGEAVESIADRCEALESAIRCVLNDNR